MKKAEKVFNIFVTILVVLTGAGFGVLTGLIYSEKHWWVGLITGAVSGYPLAILYLRRLVKLSATRFNRKMIWFLGTLIAIISGIICTTVVHGVMIALVIYDPDMSLMRQTDGFWPIFLMVGEGVGAVAGLILGGICSLVYVLKIKGKQSEDA